MNQPLYEAIFSENGYTQSQDDRLAFAATGHLQPSDGKLAYIIDGIIFDKNRFDEYNQTILDSFKKTGPLGRLQSKKLPIITEKINNGLDKKSRLRLPPNIEEHIGKEIFNVEKQKIIQSGAFPQASTIEFQRYEIIKAIGAVRDTGGPKDEHNGEDGWPTREEKVLISGGWATDLRSAARQAMPDILTQYIQAIVKRNDELLKFTDFTIYYHAAQEFAQGHEIKKAIVNIITKIKDDDIFYNSILEKIEASSISRGKYVIDTLRRGMYNEGIFNLRLLKEETATIDDILSNYEIKSDKILEIGKSLGTKWKKERTIALKNDDQRTEATSKRILDIGKERLEF